MLMRCLEQGESQRGRTSSEWSHEHYSSGRYHQVQGIISRLSIDQGCVEHTVARLYWLHAIHRAGATRTRSLRHRVSAELENGPVTR
eukprot:12938567-Prorocentrum_lima.AAC.1